MDRRPPRQHPANSKALRRTFRRKQTPTEAIVWRLLRDRRLARFKFRRQHPIGPYIVDFCCLQYRLIIEIDGDSHFVADGPMRDKERCAYIESMGFQFLRFMSTDVLTNEKGITQTIYDRLTDLSHLPKEHPSP